MLKLKRCDKKFKKPRGYGFPCLKETPGMRNRGMCTICGNMDLELTLCIIQKNERPGIIRIECGVPYLLCASNVLKLKLSLGCQKN